MDWDRGAVSGAKSIAGSMGLSDTAIYIEIRRSRRKGQSEADIRAVTRLTIRGSRRALDRFTRWVTSLMI